jgi:hypothetical protein
MRLLAKVAACAEETKADGVKIGKSGPLATYDENSVLVGRRDGERF